MLKVEDLITDSNFDISLYEGYIYLTIDLETGRQYLGKKNFFHNVKTKIGKKENINIPITRGRRATTKIVRKESDWKSYYGSANEIKNIIKNNKDHKLIRLVLEVCSTKKELTYSECKYMFKYNVLHNPRIWINDNILGKFFTKDFIKLGL